jgi:tetratricopeptide (TPR) repeat protein
MMTAWSRVARLSAAVLALVVVCAMPRVSAAQDAAVARGESELGEAKALFDALDYEHAVPAFDRAIATLEPLAAQQITARPSLATAYELRGRARFGLGDKDGAIADFKSLLGVNPAFAFASQVSPRVVALLDEVKASTIGTLILTVDPVDAQLEVNGQPFTAAVAGGVPVKAGEFTVKATRLGYKSVEQSVAVAAGEVRQLGLTLERTAAAVFLITSPADVEVLVDGMSKGRTAAGPPGAAFADAAGQLGVAPEAVSKPLILSDLGVGPHTVEFRKGCHVNQERRLTIENLADYKVEPVLLKRAVGTVVVESAPAGASVFLDGAARGTAPVTLDDVCEGARLVELRGSQGRFVKRLTVKSGDQLTVQGALKPGFALLPAGAGVANSGVADPRTAIEKSLASSQRVTLFVPDARAVEDAGKSGELPPPEWLAFDAGRRPVGGATAISTAARRELSAKLAKELDVQGVAAITQPSPSSPELVIALLAAGAGEPDVVSIVPERVDSVNRAMSRFDFVPPLVMNTIGVMAVEVTNADGVIVASVDPGSSGAQAGLKAGDIITKADGQSTNAPGVFQRALDARKPADKMVLEVTDRTGAAKSIEIPIQQRARLISPSDQTLLFNPLSLALKTRLATADPAEQPTVRLNLGVALMRLGDYAAARDLLESVQLPDGPGVSKGTQQYLLGLAYEGMGDVASAQAAWQQAAKSDAWLTEDGPAVRSLAERKLAGRSTGAN